MIFHSLYPTREQASQNSVPPSSHHPNGPRSHSAHARSLSFLPVSCCDCTTGRVKPMFSNAIGEGVTSHHWAVSGGGGRVGRRLCGGMPCGSICTLARSTHSATPALRITLPHSSRGHKRSNLFDMLPVPPELGVHTSKMALNEASDRGAGRLRIERCSASHSPGGNDGSSD